MALVFLVLVQKLAPPAGPPPRVTPRPAPTRRPPGPLPPAPAPRPEVTPPVLVEPEPYRPRVGRLGEFDRRVDGSDYRLTWGFIDHHGARHRVTCRVDRDEHERAVARFGYEEAALDAARDARLQAMVERAVRQRGLEEHVRVEVTGGTWRARHTIPGELAPAEQQRLDGEIQGFYSWLQGAFRREWETVTRDLLAEGGIRFDGHRYSIDYAGVAQGATAPLVDCTRALEAAARAELRRELGVFLAFFQEIPYELPPRTWRGRAVFGFYVPTEVLVGHHGDCDSKAVAFAAMWRHLSRPVLLIQVPGHMLLGVEMRPGPDERFVRLGNRYFVLCEVAGPAKRHPGWSDASGWFEYLLIEPERYGAAEGRSLLPDR